MSVAVNVEDNAGAGRAAVPAVSVVGRGYARGAPVPWPVKMGLKIALSRLRLPYGLWEKAGIFRHGDLAHDYAGLEKSFNNHFDFYRERSGGAPETCLELGPGDSLGHALAAKAAGVRGMRFVDVGDFASRDPAHYRGFYDYLRAKGAAFDPAPDGFSREEILSYAGGVYGTRGLHSLCEVPDSSVDFSFSHAVLEHVRRDEFAAHMRELYRIHRPGGLSRHWVDLHDHLGGALNSMRFASAFWEGAAVGGAGFYTNRLTMAAMTEMAEQAGFEAEILRVNKWESLPTPHGAMHQDFRGKSEEELNVCTFLVVFRKG